jgi:ABC-type sugar transport system permease subunit
MLKKLKRYWYRQDKVAYVFLAPSLVVLFLFAFIPLVCSIVIGFMNMDIFFKNISFAGMNNFIQAFQDARFLNAIKKHGDFCSCRNAITGFDWSADCKFTLYQYIHQ